MFAWPIKKITINKVKRQTINGEKTIVVYYIDKELIDLLYKGCFKTERKKRCVGGSVG